ncbi:GntR family transcriptional regulator [Microbacterium sp. 18062]|uniref:GntR family transcriptional regulator n=1 Tax=Microbacterium sp. 18062 TaxID=2681410 RepID=UPI001359B307|nr:GntR family transcriptional regulator [Microbacterium sp. 18062]
MRDLISAAIRDGHLAEDDQLLEDVLIDMFGASRNAVRRALTALADEGKMQRKPRVGTFPTGRGVKLNIRDITTSVGDLALKIVDQGLVPTFGLLRDLLKTYDERVRMVENVFQIADTTIGVRTAYYREIYVPTIAFRQVDMANVAETLFSVHLGSSVTEVGAGMSDQHTSRLLGIAAGSPVLTRQQLFLDDAGHPFQVVFDHYRADHVSFIDSHQ